MMRNLRTLLSWVGVCVLAVLPSHAARPFHRSPKIHPVLEDPEFMNMRATRISPWVLVLSLAAVVPPTSNVRAADHDFETNIVYRLLSVEDVNGQLVIEAEGTGQSSLLGTVTAAATVTQSESPDPCVSYSADFLLIVTAGTIQIHSGGTVCPPPSQITGEWTVTGGTGAFLNATGSGTEEGKQSFTGNDPVFDRLRGALSYEEPETAGRPLSYNQCLVLNDRYARAYLQAKACNPLEDPVGQCLQLVESGLICACPGYVNTRNQRAMKIMDALRQEFTVGQCSRYFADCIGTVCSVYGAFCEGEGDQGYCRDWNGW
jgi:hypothetical protein